MIAVALVVGGAVVLKLLSANPSSSTGGTFPNSVGQTTGKPASFLGGLLGGTTPSPTPATSADLSRELKNTVDDGGATELDSLQSDTSRL